MSTDPKVVPIEAYQQKPLGRWALETYPSPVLAEHLGIRSAGRARRVRAEALDPVSITCSLASDQRGDGARIVTVVQQAHESGFLRAAETDPRQLRQRIGYLIQLGIHAQHAQLMRALVDRDRSINDAASSLGSALTELVVLRRALGLERAS